MAAGQAKRRQTHQNIPRSLSNFSTPETPSNEFVIPTDDWSLASTVALPSQLYELGHIEPLSSVNSRTTDRYFYLSHVTLPVVAVLGLTSVFIMVCSVNNMWYDFIKEVVSNKQGK